MYYNITHVKKSTNIFDILTFKFDLIVLNDTFSFELKKNCRNFLKCGFVCTCKIVQIKVPKARKIHKKLIKK